MNAQYLRDFSNTHAIDVCVYISQIQKLTIFLLPKTKNTDISKTGANWQKPMVIFGFGDTKYPKTIKILWALEKNFFC